MAKMSIIFDGFAKLAEDLDAIGGDLHAAVDEALEETQTIVQHNLVSAASVYMGGARKGLKGYAKGDMYDSIIEDLEIEWKGTVAEVNVGFSGEINLDGFFHSIFVMYGTPKMDKDPKIYQAIKGTKTKKEIAAAQKEIMVKHLELGKAGD